MQTACRGSSLEWARSLVFDLACRPDLDGQAALPVSEPGSAGLAEEFGNELLAQSVVVLCGK